MKRTCPNCGALFDVPYVSSPKRFCGRSCGTQSHINNADSRNPNWRGGKTKHYLYDTYMDMVARCVRPTHHAYARYGGRGITVCAAWRASFWTFVEDVGDRPPGTSLDRINNDGPYCRENCRWATPKTQAANSRRRPPQTRSANTGRYVSA